MVASAVFITDLSGKAIISRNYRGDIPLTKAIERFAKYLTEVDDEAKTPVFHVDTNDDVAIAPADVGNAGAGGSTFVYVRHNNLYLCAVTCKNSNVALIVTFLYKLAGVFKDYFGTLEEESIRDNFVCIYELLDEAMDHGLPQSLDSTILRSFITQEGNRMADDSKSKPPVALTNAVSWRAEGIKHKKNEIFLDVVEKLNLLVAANGTVLHSEINGAVKMKSFLSGMPELKLGLNDKLMFEATGRSNQAKGKSVELEDIKFHQCVRLARFENDRTISFIPPDGEFDLMTYRLNTHVKPLIWVEAVVEPHRGSRIEYMIKTRSQFKSRSVANNVEIIIPVPPDVDSPSFKSSVGNVTYLPDKDAIVWNIKQFHGGREYLMRAHFGLPSISASEADGSSKKKGHHSGENSWKAPIAVKFEIPYFTVSGIQVRYLKIIERSGYQALPWVRYITANGDYQLRMA
uniref:MHD domain-containing protein n=1 Tax=Helicotheca tamesis TaxID=374047 RepID=A0A7S2IAE2_9STRA|mmetsp:Transcript_7224/g.9801  ORF Transcript_7224/g.9801 Transcript_7224/m.9801 type:complete len:460 (+) Transcript_7224:141-1520(+)|eukprot:CAMPEP_0185724228 /NCGR_PEP_ID=MMETSP1171-20130828/772_1 /TAXON_ID=374046 /ORGANISM="Helicotheca tamensis, Strain CCMP826" /LENGTH=459 /DNA_ID=CAMNT_0028392031 /DNA_START=118 /DNA_END=1497 /DNA_ORIENTATION=-